MENKKLKMNQINSIYFTLILTLFIIGNTVQAVAPSPEVLSAWEKNGTTKENFEKLMKYKEMGMCAPAENSIFNKSKVSNLATAGDVDTINVLLLCVDFSDHVFFYSTNGQTVVGQPYQFDSVLFSRKSDTKNNPSGSMTEYYLENSYGKLYIKGKSSTWLRMPQPYSYYVGDDNGVSKSRELARHAVEEAFARGVVNFSDYDLNNDGELDGLIIVHAGPGEEADSESAYEAIWSHRWVMDSAVTYDGVRMFDYITVPEESNGTVSPIGVVCHEFGHLLGLIDLYDTSPVEQPSSGLGNWSLMASGSYNGHSKIPSHLDAWSKIKAGFVVPIEITNNLYQQEIPRVEELPIIFKLANNSITSTEYWLVENRQKEKFDWAIPGEGLCIYHIDESVANNNNPNRFRVALEQPDGRNELAFVFNELGDWGDVWPDSGRVNFHDLTIPSSRTNSFVTTGFGVWNISDEDSLMYADLDVGFSRPWVELDRVNPAEVYTFYNNRVNDLIEPGDTVTIYIRAKNFMRTTYNATATMSSNRNDLTFLNNTGLLATAFDNSQYYRSVINPIKFIVDDSIRPAIDSFYVTIVSDSLADGSGAKYTNEFAFTLQLGKTSVLIVDDDDGEDYDTVYTSSLSRIKIAHDKIESSATLSIEDLMGYSIVFWHTGDSSSDGISSAEMDVIKQYLDSSNGSLFMSSRTIVEDVRNVDPFFLSNYFRCTAANDSINTIPITTGTTVGNLWEDLSFFVQVPKFEYTQLIEPLFPGEAIFAHDFNPGANSPICGVSYSGAFKSILMTMPVEYFDNENVNSTPTDSLFSRVIQYFGMGFVTDVIEQDNRQGLPISFSLKQNYPNPFNPETTIRFTIDNSSGSKNSVKTQLHIYNSIGQRVKTLVDDYISAGFYQINWDGTSTNGYKVASGVYLYQLIRGKQSDSRKMILLK